MDDKIRRSCPNCCQLYHIKHQSSNLIGNLPLFLTCGHSICENCIRSLTKFQEPIQCKVCLRLMEMKKGDVLTLAHDEFHLYQMFPVNYQILGELTLQLMWNVKHETQNDEYFIDIQAILKQHDSIKEKCMECPNLTSKMCKQCDTALCEGCFNKTHKNFVIFKNHSLQKIDLTPETSNNCKIHDDKQLDYYCTDCCKAICMDCLLVGSDKSCKEHNLKSTSEINDSHMEEIIKIQPKVEEIFRRLSKTAVDIGHLLYNIQNETGPKSEVSQIIADIEQHFSKLCFIVQKHKQETIQIVTKVKSAERESLLKAKNDVSEAMKKAKQIIKLISTTADSTMFKQMNLSVLLEDAKKLTETPWYLLKEEDKNNEIKMKVNEDLNELISDYIHLEGNATSVYKLRTPEELGEGVDIPPPPSTLVYPPQMPRDVRQLSKSKEPTPKPKDKNRTEEHQKSMTFFKQAPRYYSKSGSVNSLDSCSSDSSKMSYVQSESYQGVHQVKPYVESQDRKPLREGSQELIYVSHIVDPHNFYIQRASEQKLVKELLREYRNAVSLPKPLHNHVAEGKIYLAYNKADNLWQRCRVINFDKKDAKHPKFVVYCFDFGSIETVSVNHLRLLPPAQWYTPPPLAIHCELANCEPISGQWMGDDAILIQNIIDNKQAVMHIRRIIEQNGCLKLNCDVTTFADKISLAHALVFHERAKMTNPKLKYPFINTIGEKPKIITSNNDFKLRSTYDVNITHIVNPDKFYIRKVQHQRDFYGLNEEINQEYSLCVDAGKIYLPELGMACVVNTEKYRNPDNSVSLREDITWARCVVTEIGMRGRIRVQLVDCGFYLFVHWTSLRVLQPRFTTLRALATECHLVGVTPLNKKWSPTSVSLLKKYQNHNLEMQVEELNRNRGSMGVALFDKYDEENNVCINNEMVKYKFAIPFGIFNFNTNQDLKDQTYTYKSPLDKPVQTIKQNKITILNRDSLNKIDDEDLVAKDKGPLRLEAKVLQYLSPSVIYISVAHQEKMFNEMFENMQKYYADGKCEGKAEWRVGDKCCTMCVRSQTWRRAAVLDLQGDNAKVFYTDFASVETVPAANLKELAPEFASILVAAVKCHLSGVMPAIGEEWPSITKEFLKELLDAYPRVFITKTGNFKDNSMPVEIWVFHTIQGGALEPDKSEWRCLNQKVIEQGLGIPIKSEQIEPDKNEGNGDDEEILKFLNITGSVREWLQLEPMPTKPLLTKSESESISGSSTAVECEDANEPDIIHFQNRNSIFVSEWLPAEPFRTDEFTAVATFVDNNGLIYLHDVAQEGTFDLIRNALNVRYHDPDPKAKYMKWSIAEPCVALYHYDNNFYRGRVVEVNVVTSNCLVHYIDYGNEEVCSFANMRKSIALHQIPTQAHKCVFNRIQPAGKQWERQTLDYTHKLIVEKHCHVKVSGYTVDGIALIDMKYDKLWINDHLVDFDLAKYREGYQAVELQFAAATSSACDVATAVHSVHSDGDDGPDFAEDNEPDEPDIAEDFEHVQNEQDALEFTSLKGKDWNVLVAEENEKLASITGKDIAFPQHPDNEFKCNITIINDSKIFPLSIIHDPEISMVYEEMFKKIQLEGDSMPPLHGIFKNKACIAIFAEDKQWYRAMIMEYSPVQTRIRVRFVDYGNVDLIPLTDAREIHDEWTNLPPLTVAAKLHGVNLNPEFDVDFVSKEFSDVFLDKGPFDAKIIDNIDFIPTVELRDSNNELVYKKLVENGVFLKWETND